MNRKKVKRSAFHKAIEQVYREAVAPTSVRGKPQHPAFLLWLEYDPTKAVATIEPSDQSLVSYTEIDAALSALNWGLQHAIHGDLITNHETDLLGTPNSIPEDDQIQQDQSSVHVIFVTQQHQHETTKVQESHMYRGKSKSDPAIVAMLEGFFEQAQQREVHSDSESQDDPSSRPNSSRNSKHQATRKKASDDLVSSQQQRSQEGCTTTEKMGIISYSKIAKQCCALDREDMLEVEALCQLDNKYILAKWRSLVLVFDQHAVHERIRLERLENNVFGLDGTQHNFEPVTGSWLWPLSETDAARLAHYHAQVSQWGFKWRLVQEHGGTQAAHVTQVPKVAGVVLDAPSLKSFLAALEASGGSTSTRPPSITNILATQACKSAIKFGDVLADGVCQNLLNALSACRLPFQCAHGRPNVYPLADCEAVLAYATQHKASSTTSDDDLGD